MQTIAPTLTSTLTPTPAPAPTPATGPARPTRTAKPTRATRATWPAVPALALLAAAALPAGVQAQAQTPDAAPTPTVPATAPAAAPAKPSVSLYGLIDEGVELVTQRVNSAGSTTDSVRIGSGTAASRFGLRGDTGGLSPDLKGLFVLEAGISADLGTLGQGGRIFGRQAFVGVQGRYGTVTLGRQLTMRFFGMVDADLYGAGSHGLGSLDSAVPNARADNTLAYSGTFGPVTAGLNYSFGRDASPASTTTSAAATNCAGEAYDAMQCREWSAMLRYATPTWGVIGAIERQYGGTAAVAGTTSTAPVPATFGGLTDPSRTDTRSTLNGFFHLAGTKVGLGVLARDNKGSSSTPKSRLWWAATDSPLGASGYTLTTMLSTLRYADSPNRADMLNLRVSTFLMKDLMAYVTWGYIKNRGGLNLSASTSAPTAAPPVAGSQNSVITGVKYNF